MGDMADMALNECFEADELYAIYCSAPANIQYEHDLCDERGFMYNSGVYKYKLNCGPGKCPKCDADTKLKTGKYGQFYGCSTFPICNGSRPYK